MEKNAKELELSDVKTGQVELFTFKKGNFRITRTTDQYLNEIMSFLSGDPKLKTHIYNQLNTSNKVFTRYLDLLLSLGMVDAYEDSGKMMYRLTERGMFTLSVLSRINDALYMFDKPSVREELNEVINSEAFKKLQGYEENAKKTLGDTKRYRSSNQIIEQMLYEIKNTERELQKTDLMKKTKLNLQDLNKYMTYLRVKGLIIESNPQLTKFDLTPDGDTTLLILSVLDKVLYPRAKPSR